MMKKKYNFCHSLFSYRRNVTRQVQVGHLTIGGDAPVRIQSMTTTNTLDTAETVEQSIKIADAGGELVRITTQGRREAANLADIKNALKKNGYFIPLAADVHFNPSAASVAAGLVEKVRINPGNFTGGPGKIKKIEEEQNSDQAFKLQIENKLIPFLSLCKEHETAIRIGTNHGSLSERMMKKFGDTPEGMVESCMEYLRICRERDFHNIVLSIKSSNTRVMVHTVRLLVVQMAEEGMAYPLHLGVTEAGSGEDGRLKSAVGIGALLADGIGDTIRVSLTEPPENEIPVAQKLVAHYSKLADHTPVKGIDPQHYSPLKYAKRVTHTVGSFGGENPAGVVLDIRHVKTVLPTSQIPELIWCHPEQLEQLPPKWTGVLKIVEFYDVQKKRTNDVLPLFGPEEPWRKQQGAIVLRLSYEELNEEIAAGLEQKQDVILLVTAKNKNVVAEQRAFFMWLQNHQLTHPAIVQHHFEGGDTETFQIESAADTGPLFLDGYGDGICLSAPNQSLQVVIATSFGIMQASRLRFFKTEYISCPGCGRTLFDLQSTTQKIQEVTSHLKGLKIAVMGCIVNGIGEMADADYGYVGAGKGKISLYRNRELIRKNIPEEEAVEDLVRLIKKYGDWKNPID